ncbi:hypothetical protein BGX29_003252 [Mortierella sp. GBA35]|nr:hypothetical protein BGX29_003252 [Mortierella sp. GBA35]
MNRTTNTVVVTSGDTERRRLNWIEWQKSVLGKEQIESIQMERKYYRPPQHGLYDCADTVLEGEAYNRPRPTTVTTDLIDFTERTAIRILDDFVIYNWTEPHPEDGFAYSHLEKCLDRTCDIGISGRVHPAWVEGGQILGRKRNRSSSSAAAAGGKERGDFIHLSRILVWGQEMLDNSESFLWVKTQFAVYILGVPARSYGPYFDDIFTKTRLTNMLMVALLANRDVTLDDFVSNHLSRTQGSGISPTRSPRRVFAGGPRNPEWDLPLTLSDLKTHCVYVQEEARLWWKDSDSNSDPSRSAPPIFKELDYFCMAQNSVARPTTPPRRRKRDQEEI